jgi:2-dehydropantoate 2-reductase
VRVAIVGAGAIGCTYAWYLARGGHGVVLLDVREDHVAAIARAGLIAELPDGREEAAAVQASSDARSLPPADVLLVATKSFATEEAARGALPLAGARTRVTTVQNGLGNVEALGRVFGAERVVPGSTTVAAEPGRAGRVRIAASVVEGRSKTALGAGLEGLAAALTASGLPALVDPEVELVVWRKLVLAGSMGPLSAVLGSTVGGTLRNPQAVALLRRMIEEIAAVARACGVPLEEAESWALAEATFGSLGDHRASMAVDLTEGRRTEIEAMCLEVARLGREHGVPAPVNEVVGELVRALEARAQAA